MGHRLWQLEIKCPDVFRGDIKSVSSQFGHLNRMKNGHFDLKINGHFGHITVILVSDNVHSYILEWLPKWPSFSAMNVIADQNDRYMAKMAVNFKIKMTVFRSIEMTVILGINNGHFYRELSKLKLCSKWP